MTLQTLYQNALQFAAQKHTAINQLVPGTNLPYVVHISNVAMEILIASKHTEGFNADVAVQVALLHDTIEDTQTSLEEIKIHFGEAVAQGVAALTKRKDIPKLEAMQDSLQRIKAQPKEVRAVKLADRITNLQPPPKHWTADKMQTYQKEALLILEELKGTNDYLENRLKEKCEEYSKYFSMKV